MLRIIKTAQRLGFTLDEVADLLDTATHRHGRRREPGLHARVQAKLADIEQKIADLTVIRARSVWPYVLGRITVVRL